MIMKTLRLRIGLIVVILSLITLVFNSTKTYAVRPVDDEKNVCFRQDCDNGTSCECVGCEMGDIDCTPTCPCCDEG